MKFSVCIAATRATTLRAAVESIWRQTWADWELVIVGQGADAQLSALGMELALADERTRYVHLEHQGLSYARNVAIRVTTGDIIAMTDDDCEADEVWLSTLANIFSEEPEVGLVGGSLIAPAPTRRLATCPQLQPTEALYDPVTMCRQAPDGWDWIGANFAIRREVVQRVGEFDECLGAGAVFPVGEDTDYKLRLEALGIKMVSTPRSVVYHTYGYRYGLAAVLRSSRSYARGNGALAGKLTLMGDPRGREWLEMTRRNCTVEWVRQLRLGRRGGRHMTRNPLRLWHFAKAYRECVRIYSVDPDRGTLLSASIDVRGESWQAMGGLTQHGAQG
jgi:glycosyltransferase involved in cell wall biosynthesis